MSSDLVTKENKKASSLTDVEDQFAFYGQYHTQKINVLIHIVCVPLIFWSAQVLVNYATGSPSLGSFTIPYFDLKLDLTPGQITALAYATYFVVLEPVAGLLYFPILLLMGHSSNVYLRSTSPLGLEKPMQAVTIVHVVCWIAQFIGHGVFEGRAPALLNSLFQSIVLAVFFVFMEVLFALGYRPDLHKRLKNRIGKAVLAYRQSKRKNGQVPTQNTDRLAPGELKA